MSDTAPLDPSLPETKEVSPERAANKLKFELELETIQSLANPHYLLELSSTGYLDSPIFLNFLDYLAYWEQPDFARFVIYPQCFHHRRLLLLPQFRQALKTNGPELVAKLAEGQYEHWKTWRNLATQTGTTTPANAETKEEAAAAV